MIHTLKVKPEKISGVLACKLPPGAGKTALDFGCGSGSFSKELLCRGYTVIGYDIEPQIGEKITAFLSSELKKRFVFFCGDWQEIQNHYSAFDLIICREVLEHMPDKEELLSFFGKLISSSGLLVISVPTAASERVFSKIDPHWLQKSRHTQILNSEYLTTLFVKYDFCINQRTSEGFRWSLLWLLLAPFRVKHTMGNPSFDNPFVRFAFKLSGWIASIKLIDFFGNNIFPKSHVYYLSKTKSSILCVYDYEDWILGTWAKNIENLYSDTYNVFSISMLTAEENPKFAKKLVTQVDLVYLLLPHAFAFFKALNPKVLVCAIHHWVKYSEFYKLPIEASDYLVTGAQEWKEKILEKNPQARIFVTNSGFDKRFLINYAPREFGMSTKLRIGFFGKYSSNEFDRKGTRHLRRLIKLIVSGGHASEYQLKISGTGWDAFIDEISSCGIEVKYEKNVPADDMPSVYRAIDVYLVLSDIEGGPATIAESMISGCVIISTKIGIARDVIHDGKNGFLVTTKDIDGIYKILEDLRGNPARCLEISRAAHAFAKKNLKYAKTFKPLRQLFATAIKTKTLLPVQEIRKRIHLLPSKKVL